MKKLRFLGFLLLLCLTVACSNSSGVVPVGMSTMSVEDSVLVSDQGVRNDLLLVTFLDVGQGDATLLEYGEFAMLIDGGDSNKSDLIYTVLRDRDITHLDYIVVTHAHADHVGGINGALNFATVGTVISSATEYDTRAFNSFLSNLERLRVDITLPVPGSLYMLGDVEVHILGPSVLGGDPNDESVIVKIIYGDVSILFTGDAERNAEQRLLDEGRPLDATVLHVGHHGSETSTIYPFLREVMPSYAVISCGKDNQYGHPTEDVLSRLRDADVIVFRTDMQGDITVIIDGQSVSFRTDRNETVQTNPTGEWEPGDGFIGNVNSKRFHLPSCSSLPAEHNRVFLESLGDALSQGFEPCGVCRP